AALPVFTAASRQPIVLRIAELALGYSRPLVGQVAAVEAQLPQGRPIADAGGEYGVAVSQRRVALVQEAAADEIHRRESGHAARRRIDDASRRKMPRRHLQ